MAGNVRGFDPAPVYRTYDKFVDDNERSFIEYMLRDVYKAYGYDFNYYDGREMTIEDLERLLEKCTTNIDYIVQSNWQQKDRVAKVYNVKPEDLDSYMEERINKIISEAKELRQLFVEISSSGISLCNREGETLHFMKMLEPVPELMEQPLYH